MALLFHYSLMTFWICCFRNSSTWMGTSSTGCWKWVYLYNYVNSNLEFHFVNKLFKFETWKRLFCFYFYVVFIQDSLFNSGKLLSMWSCLPCKTATKESMKFSVISYFYHRRIELGTHRPKNPVLFNHSIINSYY